MTTNQRSLSAHRRERGRGQALVEFSLALIPFLLILMGIFDLGRGVYMNNGVNQAAREIARTTAVHPCNTSSCTLGNSSETLATIAAQKGLVPGMQSNSVTFACTTVSDVVVAGTTCGSGKFVRITVSVPYAAITPLLSMVAPTTFVSTAHVQVP
ncbi:MAG: pilus assembly protein [Acidimicrobiia bacterium]|nr:pilus assembly protein [Acidimicrobiia bacterium]